MIGIIAVLISILLPAMNKARQQALRAACLSNLRQVHQAFALYALDFHDQVPLGYRTVSKQFNSMLYSMTAVPAQFDGTTAGRFVLFGHLFQRHLMADGRAFYCPAESNDAFIYNSELNPWPDYNATTAPAGNTKNIQAGYSLRPEQLIPDVLSLDSPLPRLSKFKNKAIMADLTSAKVRVDTRHRIGMNALFGDGSAVWIPVAQFIKPMTPIVASTGKPDAMWNNNIDDVWAALDRR